MQKCPDDGESVVCAVDDYLSLSLSLALVSHFCNGCDFCEEFEQKSGKSQDGNFG